jgi:hypothetical protein
VRSCRRSTERPRSRATASVSSVASKSTACCPWEVWIVAASERVYQAADTGPLWSASVSHQRPSGPINGEVHDADIADFGRVGEHLGPGGGAAGGIGGRIGGAVRPADTRLDPFAGLLGGADDEEAAGCVVGDLVGHAAQT